MGVFRVPAILKNWQNEFLAEDRRGEDVECELLVDTEASELALPAEIIARLKLKQTGEVRVYVADGDRPICRVFGIVDLTVQGRSCQVRAIELPNGTKPLLGAVPLEEMDWHVAPQGRELVPNPESPDGPLLALC